MAASSSVPFRKKLYDVFISFRGEDTHKTFTSHLYKAFDRKKIKAYIDEESLERGDEISPALMKAIQESKISVVILSENYATSSWCLDELCHVLQCKETDEQIVIPVFYNVEPANVRHQKESYAIAFTAHENRFRHQMDKVQKWKNALTTVSDIAGLHSSSATGGRSEAELVEEIVKDVMGKLNCLSPSNDLKEKGLVGMDKRIEQFQSLLNNGSQEVRIVGIWGIGGIGKTTLARVFFDRFASQFEGSCFLEDVKGESKRRGFTNLQKALFSKLLGEVNEIAEDRLQRTKALVVLDDVDSVEQLEYLVEQVSFGHGSKIIITTRDSQLLKIIDGHEILYQVEELNFEEALQLFCSKAFRRNSPPEDYKLLSHRVVEYTRGLPLALKVLGSHLHSKSPKSWESALNKLKKCPNKEIHEVLRISYDGLDRNAKEMFLDIACFFNGKDKELVERILHDRDVEIGIDILIAKSLITLEENRLCTHDLLREMGWEIVREEYYDGPRKRSMLWLAKDIYHVLKYNTGTIEIQVISLNIHELESDIDLDPSVFKDMINLKYLSIDGYFDDLTKKLNLPQGLLSLPDELIYLCWNRYPSRTLPPNFKPQNLVELELPGSKLEKLWDGVQNFGSLKVLDLQKSENLIEIPNLSQALNVEQIYLGGCTSLEHLPSSIVKLKSLRLLVLDKCSKLEYLPEISEPMPNLRSLFLSESGITDLPESIYNLIGIECLFLSGCQNLKSLPTTIYKLKSLEKLHLSNCPELEYLPEISEPMPNLKDLDLWASGFIDLPESIYNLIGIENLFLSYCKNLKSLPTTIYKLKSLEKLHLSNCPKLEYLPEISEPMPNLRDLDLWASGIIDLPESIYNLIGIESLVLNNCQNLKSLPTTFCKLKSLKKLTLHYCHKLEYLPDGLESMPNLTDLDVNESGIRKLPTSSLETGNDTFFLFNCKNLELIPHNIYNKIHLYIDGCPKLKSMPRPLSSGTNLVVHLSLRGTSVSQIPNNLFSCLTSLSNLDLYQANIRRIPENIKFSKLCTLNIKGCRFLQSLPELPLTIEKVDASGCTSLKMVSNLLTALTQPPTDRVNLGVTFSFMDCLKLEHQNLMSEFQMRSSLIATKFALRKTPYEFFPPSTQMCYPGDNIPEWFSYQKKGRSINIRLPCNSNFMGFAFCFILSCEKYNRGAMYRLHLFGEIYVKTLNGDERHLPLDLWLLSPNAKNHVVMTTFMCDVENFYSAVEMSFNFTTNEEASVKRCGIRLLRIQDAMEFGIISSQYVCRKSNVVNDEGGPSLSWESILEQLRHFQVSSSRKKLCEKIWSSNLNHRYKILWWRLLRDALPVRAALNYSTCPLCGSDDTSMESAIHLFLFCERVRPLWFMSRWELRTDSLCDFMASVLEIVLDRNYDQDFLIYASLLVETIWRATYDLVYDGKEFDNVEIHSSVQDQFNQISTSKRKRKWRSLTLRKSCVLKPQKSGVIDTRFSLNNLNHTIKTKLYTQYSRTGRRMDIGRQRLDLATVSGAGHEFPIFQPKRALIFLFLFLFLSLFLFFKSDDFWCWVRLIVGQINGAKPNSP